MKEIDFNPKTMKLADASDFFRMYKKLWPKINEKVKMPTKKNGFHSNRKNGFVYIVRDIDGNLKVGSAHDVKKRLVSLNWKYGDVTLVATIAAFRFMFLEKFLHYELSEFHVRNEWFYSSNEEDIFEKISLFLIKHGSIFHAEELTFVKSATNL